MDKKIIEVIPGFVIIADEKAVITEVNSSVCDLTGYSKKELVGKNLSLLLEGNLLKNVQEEGLELFPSILRDIKEKHIMKQELTYYAKDGSKKSVLFSGTFVAENTENSSYFFCVAQDTSKQLETSSQLIHLEKLSTLGELSAGIAHEMKQPLNIIKIINQGLLRDIIKNRLDEDELKEDLNEVNNQVNKMAEIIDHIRSFSRKTVGDTYREFSLNEVVESVCKFHNVQFDNRNISLSKVYDENLPDMTGDIIQIEQVLINLFLNSRSALESSKKDDQFIKVRTYALGGEESPLRIQSVVFEIEDNGEGIPYEHESRIFEQFFTTKPSGLGTGLGLSISKKIIEGHEGKIELENKIGEGVTFKVILPVKRENELIQEIVSKITQKKEIIINIGNENQDDSSLDFVKQLIDVLQVGLIVVGGDLKVRYVNQRFTDIMGTPEILDDAFIDYFSKIGIDVTLEKISSCIKKIINLGAGTHELIKTGRYSYISLSPISVVYNQLMSKEVLLLIRGER